MLNLQEREKVLESIIIACNLAPLPLQVNLGSRELEPASKRKKCICTVSYNLFVLHALYKACGLAYSILFESNVQLHQLVIHAIVALASILFALWYYMVYVSCPALFATFIKMTLVGNIGGERLTACPTFHEKT